MSDEERRRFTGAGRVSEPASALAAGELAAPSAASSVACSRLIILGNETPFTAGALVFCKAHALDHKKST